MNLLYNITIQLASVVLKLLSLFNNKLKLGVDGRALTFNKLDQFLNKGDKTLWFHCASLGEYEQGLPIFTELRKDYPNHKIVLSFFFTLRLRNKKKRTLCRSCSLLTLRHKK